MQQYFIANWKQHKTAQETRDFLTVLNTQVNPTQLTDKQIVICPSYPSLSAAAQIVKEHGIPVSLGAQDISAYPDGAYTGEVGGDQIREFADFVIIGHSERRRYFQESNELIEQKVAQAKAAGLTVILCVQDENEPVIQGVDIVAFEPVNAIGTGNPEDPARIAQVFEKIQAQIQVPLLYGGSVTPETVQNFTHIERLSGFLIGGASLEPESFAHIILS